MELRLRDAVPEDLKPLWELNQSEVPHVGSVDMQRMEWFLEHAHHFRVAEGPRDPYLGFMIALGPGSTYGSPNYRWFCDRYDAFVYVDRITVSSTIRRKGIGRRLYADVADAWRARAEFVACEVNTLPPNPDSIAFHERVGFSIIDQVRYPGNKQVAMLQWPIR